MKFEPKLLIKNYGPVKEGYNEDGGYLTIKKVTIFIGPQGSGKSTITKLFAIYLKFIDDLDKGKEYTKFEFENYHIPSQLEKFNLKVELTDESSSALELETGSVYTSYPLVIEPSNYSPKQKDLPKTLYIPAERAFFEVLEKINLLKEVNGALGDFFC